jgi:predicted Rossmann fold flavoprotein
MQNTNNYYDLLVIGGGAAGFFCAINAAQQHKALKIIILEKTGKLLQKVKVSGGGRCNVTHFYEDAHDMQEGYPRGKNFVKKAFYQFSSHDTTQWFLQHGITLKTEQDGRMFPTTNNSETIINCFLNVISKHNISVLLHETVDNIWYSETEKYFTISTKQQHHYTAAKVCVAIGGQAKLENFSFLQSFKHTIDPLLPSLFTFNIVEKTITDLSGISIPNVTVKLPYKNLETTGPMLITHWGFSGPAVLKLSAFAASWLHSVHYNTTFAIRWLPYTSMDEVIETLHKSQQVYKAALFTSKNPFGFAQRLWVWLCNTAGIAHDAVWQHIAKTQLHKLANTLLSTTFTMKGKTTFKEEFVTCGGINISEVDVQTMQSKKQQGLFFAGEVMNVDGITGGYNFQHAWTSAYIAAKSIANQLAMH